MSMLPVEDKVYDDGMTKQSFMDSCDINKIIKKAQVSGSIAHALKYDEAVYGEFTNVDLLGAYQQVERAQKIFDDLPSEVRREFDHDALKFAGYASDPANISRLAELIPAIGKPGDFRFPKPGDLPPQAAPSSATEAAPPGPSASASEAPVEPPVDPGGDPASSST